MPTTPSTINYYIAADGTLRDGQAGSIAQTPRIYYGTEYAVTLSFPPSTIAEGDQLQVAVNRSRTFFSSASATGDAPVAAVAKHDVTAAEADAQAVTLTLSTNTRAMIDQVNGIDHPVRGFFGVHLLRVQSFISLAVADAFMLSVESGPDAISPSLPVVDYPTREEAEALTDRSEAAAERAEQAAAGIVPPLQLDAPPTTSTAGSVGQLATWHDAENNKDHLYHVVFISTSENATLYHWEECVLESQRNVANGFAGLDGEAKLSRAVLPLVGIGTNYGAVAVDNNYAYGLSLAGAGRLATYPATNENINDKTNGYRPIVPKTLNYAVRSVLPLVTEIPAATSDYSLVDSSATTLNHSHTFSHVPSQAPTYRLPSVSDTTISHYIELTVDFTNVQTYSFLDYQGEPIVPLFTPAIAAGDVYTFKMEYSGIKSAWLVYPQKQGAVADDFVMRGEVGAANGVAGLDSNAKVPSGQLPIAIENVLGIVMLNNKYGLERSSPGFTVIRRAADSDIDARTTGNTNSQWYFRPIVPGNLNYAVTAALTDNNKISLTDEQKAAAQEVFGVGGPITEIPAATTEYTLSEGIFKHAPTNAPTYNLPAITDTIRSHVIVIAIDFSSVQTFSFVPPQDSGVTFQSYANPNQGDVWVFRCVWYGGKWRICPMKIKNCVTRQLTSGALSITDAVAGDALALRMTAPMSVVMNQLVQNGATFSFDFENTSTTTLYPYMPSPNAKVNFKRILDHVYLIKAFVSFTSTDTCTFYFTSWQAFSLGSDNNYFARVASQATITFNDTLRIKGLAAGKHVTGTLSIMLVDLTQYFNGDSTLISSIQSWADLVAYDSRFASYVQYNTGEVCGVTPAVTFNNGTPITSPSELFAVGNAADEYEAVSGILTRRIGSYTFTGNERMQAYTAYGIKGWQIFEISGKARNIVILLSGYTTVSSIATLYKYDYAITGSSISSSVYIQDISRENDVTTLDAFKAWITGKTIYFELATPTTEQYTPTQISLQAGNNVAMQTDGGRLAPIDVTYESNEI